MKKVLGKVLAMVLALTMLGSAAFAEADVWALEGWPEHPAGAEIPGWEELPANSDEFRFRVTDPSVEREMEGNMYKQGWPLVEETETISVLAKQAADIVDISNGHWLIEKLEERDNVHIEWELIPAASWTDGRNLAIASNDLTDVIIGGGFSKSEQLLYGDQQGIFVDISQYFDEYTYYIKSFFEKRPDMLNYITTPSGNVYGLFSNACNFHVSMGHKMWVNTAWLEAVGMDMPTTTEEFADMLRAFKTQDPNGNGLADEMPLVGSPTGWNSRIDDFLVNAFTLHPVQANCLVSDDGVVTFSFLKDEYKEAMKYINGLYEEGLIDKESFVRDGTALSALGLANEDYDIIGAFPGGYYGVGGYDIDHTSERSSVWEPLSPLKGPDGVQVVYQDPFGALSEAQFVVTKEAENPALCVRWIDFFYSPDPDIGPEGEYWEFSKEGDLNLFYTDQSYYTPLNENFDGRSENVRVESTGFPYVYVSFDQRAMATAENANGYDALMYNWTRERYEPYASTDYVPADFYVPLDVVDDYNTMLKEIIEYSKEMATKFMTGEADIDATWDEYIATIYDLGAELVLEQAQTAYNTYYGK